MGIFSSLAVGAIREDAHNSRHKGKSQLAEYQRLADAAEDAAIRWQVDFIKACKARGITIKSSFDKPGYCQITFPNWPPSPLMTWADAHAAVKRHLNIA